MMTGKVAIVWTMLMLVPFVAGAASADPGTQVFELDEFPNQQTANFVMHTAPSPATGGSIGLAGGMCIDFDHIDPAAGAGFSAPEADWVVTLFGEGADGVYEFGIGSTGTPSQTSGSVEFQLLEPGPTQKALHVTTGGGEVTVANGDHLKFTFCTGEAMTLFTDRSSQLSTPADATPYPIPELPSGVLALVGLAAVLAFARGREL